jgi:hypothetical protein
MVVPAPAEDSTRIVPPIAVARSRMVSRPRPPIWMACSPVASTEVVKPTPSSIRLSTVDPPSLASRSWA